MYDFIHSYLKENKFKLLPKDERKADVYSKIITPRSELTNQTRLEVMIEGGNRITISEVYEKDNTETYFLECRAYSVSTIDELKFLFYNSLSSDFRSLNN